MALNVTNSLIANILSTDDTTGNVPINFGTGNPAYDSNVAQYVRYFKLAAGVNVITLPLAVCTQLYVRNIDPTRSIVVTVTPQAAGNVSIIDLNPGAQVIFWDSPTASINPGITALSLAPSAAGAFCEYFLGG